MTSSQYSNVAIDGTVKWFDSVKGFGFVLPDDGGDDILLHINILQNFGQGSVADGSEVRIIVADKSNGRQITEILEITAPEPKGRPPLKEVAGYTANQIEVLPLEPARVKWFDCTKGYGFATVFGSSIDVFIHEDILRQSTLSNLESGEALALRVVDGERGKIAVDVVVWDDVPIHAHQIAAS